jgi:hypothetical protein
VLATAGLGNRWRQAVVKVTGWQVSGPVIVTVAYSNKYHSNNTQRFHIIICRVCLEQSLVRSHCWHHRRLSGRRFADGRALRTYKSPEYQYLGIKSRQERLQQTVTWVGLTWVGPVGTALETCAPRCFGVQEGYVCHSAS